MLLFFVSCFSFILISRSMSCKPLLPLRNQLTLLSPFPWGQFSSFLMSFFRRIKLNQVLVMKPLKKMTTGPSQVLQVEDFPGEAKVSLLDLPELTLDYILERLSPAGLCSMAEVCSSMREKCRSDHLWEKHMKQKWNRLIGDAATREWQCQLASRKRPSLYGLDRRKGFDKDLLFSVWPFTWMRPNLEGRSNQPRSAFPVDSIMGLYLSLENGKFWFPAQVYNRENGHSGFMLSCYDAHVSYDSQTDTFQARYAHSDLLWNFFNLSFFLSVFPFWNKRIFRTRGICRMDGELWKRTYRGIDSEHPLLVLHRTTFITRIV
ncbi:F-box protein At2g32560-like isoform X2 [Rhodamnia argentea]|uniref:F-box protein At2g32560-like isoform X2 n=1 Tax=Rhodamnia argentea TaxID=178133 RepID=A0ABM3GTE2_9MYRT|nr:F-box protein At2g32560-like isoform X2 [Rhodamnia argentea]